MVSARPVSGTVKMGIASSERSALDELAAARTLGAKPDELLELAETAIDEATVAGDTLTLESVAVELESAARAHPEEGDGLRLRFAADRARRVAAPVVHDDETPTEPRTSSAAAEAAGSLAVLGWLALILLGGFLGAYIGASIGDALNPPVGMLEWRMYVIYGAVIGAVVGAIGLPLAVSRLIRGRRRRATGHPS